MWPIKRNSLGKVSKVIKPFSWSFCLQILLAKWVYQLFHQDGGGHELLEFLYQEEAQPMAPFGWWCVHYGKKGSAVEEFQMVETQAKRRLLLNKSSLWSLWLPKDWSLLWLPSKQRTLCLWLCLAKHWGLRCLSKCGRLWSLPKQWLCLPKQGARHLLT